MRIAFITTDSPLYLPRYFERVLHEYADKTDDVFMVPPLYEDQSMTRAQFRYLVTFGLVATVQLGVRVLGAKARRQSVASVCRRYGVPCETVPDINDESFLDRLRRRQTDLIVSVSCPQIFRRALLDVPRLGCLNVHGSVLPAYRGVFPSFWMMANDETQAGVSIFFMNERIDAGDLCAQRIFDIRPDESLHQFLERSKGIAADLTVEALRTIESGDVSRTPIDLSNGSYYSWPDRDAVRRFRAAGRRL